MGTPIVDLDGLVDTRVNANVNVVAAQDALTQSIGINDNITNVLLPSVENTATTAIATIGTEKAAVIGYASDAQTARVGAELAETNAQASAQLAVDVIPQVADLRDLTIVHKDSAAVYASMAENQLNLMEAQYLGPKAVAPTLDNLGNAIVEGSWYYHTVLKEAYSWSGTAWKSTIEVSAIPNIEFSIDANGALVMDVVGYTEDEQFEWSII